MMVHPPSFLLPFIIYHLIPLLIIISIIPFFSFFMKRSDEASMHYYVVVASSFSSHSIPSHPHPTSLACLVVGLCIYSMLRRNARVPK